MATRTPVRVPQPFLRADLDDALSQLFDALDVDACDVLAVHIGQGSVTVKTAARSPRGRLLPGRTNTATHRIIREAVEE